MKKLLAILTLSILATPSYAAGDQGLYDAAPPADAGFVRIINASDNALTSVFINGSDLGGMEAKSVSEYAIATQGTVNVKSDNNMAVSKEIKAGEYYTAIFGTGHDTIIDDTKVTNPGKAVISFYNLSDKDTATLVSITHKADIFKDVTKSSATGREINAVTVGLAVKSGEEELAIIENIELKRQENTSVFLVGKDGAYSLLTKNAKPKK